MRNDLQIGDTIKCKNGADMIKTSIELAKAGVTVKVLKNYTLEVIVINEGN